MNPAELKPALQTFICTEILMDPGRDLSGDDELLRSGLVDSLGVMRLVFFLEEACGHKVPYTDITLENFHCIDAIVGYLNGGG